MNKEAAIKWGVVKLVTGQIFRERSLADPLG